MRSLITYTQALATLLHLGQQQNYASAQEGFGRLANGFIVEYADAPEKLDMSTVLADVSSQVEQASGHAVLSSHKLDLRSSLFNGASFQLAQNKDLTAAQVAANAARARRRRDQGRTLDDDLERTLLQLPAIAAVYPNLVYYPQAPAGRVAGERELRQVQEQDQPAGGGILFPAEGTPLVNPHLLTGVDRLHAAAVGGQGVRIAVIDSGIDAGHPALGGGYGPGFKVQGGFDFVGDKPNNDVDPPAPDDSPLTTCANHGTAVSSIAAGLPYKFGFVGVAPNASLLHYKVFPCSGGVSTDVGVNASLRAFEEGVDVINASIGGQGGWSKDLWSIIARRIMDAGTVYMIAAGNDGSRGTFIANGLNSGFGVPSVGSVDNAYSTTLLADGSYIVDGESVPIKYSPGFPANWTFGVSETAPLELFVPPSVNGCIPYPANTTYPSNAVVLLPRPLPGTTTAACNQTAQVVAAGIRKMLLYNYFDNIPTRPLPISTTEGFPFEWLDATAYVDNAVGVKLAALVAGGAKVQVDFPWRPSNDTRVPRLQENTLTGGFMSNYSTWGPTYEAKVGTSFSAPGGNYLAAGGTIYGGFVVASGTSFAAPYAAGAAALIKQVHPNITAFETISRLATTARPITMQTNLRVTQDYLAPAFQQGAGLIDVYAAIYTTTTFNVSELAFNDTAFLQPQTFELVNGGSEPLTYDITHAPAPTLYTFSAGSLTVTPFNNDTAFAANILPDAHATLAFSSGTSLTVQAGASAVVTVTPTLPQGLDASRLPLYSGFVQLRSSDGYNFTLPYGGIGAPLRDVPVLDTSATQNRTFLVANVTENATVRPGMGGNNLTRSFAIPKLTTGNSTTSTVLTAVALPGIQFSPAFGSPRGEIGLLAADGSSLGAILPVGEDVASMEDNLFLRDTTVTHLFFGKMADGSFAAAGGPYRFRAKLLRVTGDTAKAEDWDEAVTEEFTLSYL